MLAKERFTKKYFCNDQCKPDDQLNQNFARGYMVEWLEWLLVMQEDLGLIPAQTKWFLLLSGKGGRKINGSRDDKLRDLAHPC